MNAHPFLDRLRDAELIARTGRVQRIFSTFIEADGPNAPLGALCAIEARAKGDGNRKTLAEIVSIGRESVVLAPLESTAQTFSGARVAALPEVDLAPVGDAMMGRAVDALGRPIDGKGAVRADCLRSRSAPSTSPLDRVSQEKVVETGVRAIDALLTLGEGQRIGVFAAAGVGKTTLMEQLANQTAADRCVICLVGERGGEVEALWRRGLAPKVRERTTLVAATSDQSAVMRVRAADYALTLAEHWRSEGRRVLLLIDSVTRLAMALREIGLAAGEPPTVRAYTPGVFAAIPKIVERCGALRSGGSITAIMTVLSETDDVDDPISEMMRSLLDGHIVLSRNLAEQGQFPAIDIPRSISRHASGLMREHERASAAKAVSLLSTYEASKTLVETGIYTRGGDPAIDEALAKRPSLLAFLRQASDDAVPRARALEALQAIVEGEA